MKIKIDNLHGICDYTHPKFQALREEYKVDNPNYWIAIKMSPYAKRYYYFITQKGKFSLGHLPAIVRLCDKLNISIEIEDTRLHKNIFKPFTKQLGEYTLYEHQYKALKHSSNTLTINGKDIPYNRGIYKMATNSGKSFIIASKCVHLNEGHKAVIFVHTVDLLNQFFKALKNFGLNVGAFGGKHKKTSVFLECDIIISTYKSYLSYHTKSKEVKAFTKSVDLLIVDECHRASAKDYARTIKLFKNATNVYGFSGTPFKKMGLADKTVYGLFGDILMEVSNEDMQKIGVSLTPVVKMYEVECDYFYSYQESYEQNIVFSQARVDKMAQYIKHNPDRQILIPVKRLDHGKFIYDALYKICDCRFVSATHKFREYLFEQYSKKEYQVLITTLGQEGLNLPIDTLIYARAEESIVSLLQYVGRILRLEGNTKNIEIVDFYDKDNKNLEKHSKNRIKIYKEEKFKTMLLY